MSPRKSGVGVSVNVGASLSVNVWECEGLEAEGYVWQCGVGVNG